MTLQVVQLIVGQWEGDRGLTYTLFALDKEGKVYRKNGPTKKWVPVNMEIGEIDSSLDDKGGNYNRVKDYKPYHKNETVDDDVPF